MGSFHTESNTFQNDSLKFVTVISVSVREANLVVQTWSLRSCATKGTTAVNPVQRDLFETCPEAFRPQGTILDS